MRAVRASRSSCGSKPSRGSKRLALDPGAAHPVEPEGALAVARAVPRVDVPVGQPPLERVRLDEARRDSPRPPSGTRSRRAAARAMPRLSVATRSSSARCTCGSGVCASSNSPNVSSSLCAHARRAACARRRRSSGRRTRARAGSRAPRAASGAAARGTCRRRAPCRRAPCRRRARRRPRSSRRRS